MKNLYISTACLKGDKDYDRVINEFKDNGITNIELTGVHPFLEMEELEKKLNYYIKQGINFTFHNYFPPPKDPIVLNYLTTNSDLKKECKKIISNAIHLAKKTGTTVYAFHPGYYREANMNPKGYFDFYGKDRKNFDYGFDIFKNDFIEFYKSLKIDKNINKINLAFENLFPNPDGSNDSFMCTYEEIEKIFLEADKNNINLNLLIDLGHLAISSNLLNFDKINFLNKVIDNFGNKIIEIHISENDFKNDLHNRVYKGSWQLDALTMFKKLPNFKNICFTMESRGLSISEIKNDQNLIAEKIY